MLTCDIPVGLTWLIEPFISKIPKKTPRFTGTRRAVLENVKN